MLSPFKSIRICSRGGFASEFPCFWMFAWLRRKICLGSGQRAKCVHSIPANGVSTKMWAVRLPYRTFRIVMASAKLDVQRKHAHVMYIKGSHPSPNNRHNFAEFQTFNGCWTSILKQRGRSARGQTLAKELTLPLHHNGNQHSRAF